MIPINAPIAYQVAEKEFLTAYTTEEKIVALKKMIATAPNHKGAENWLARLRARLSKLKKEQEKEFYLSSL